VVFETIKQELHPDDQKINTRQVLQSEIHMQICVGPDMFAIKIRIPKSI
jgi:hypothetical protein